MVEEALLCLLHPSGSLLSSLSFEWYIKYYLTNRFYNRITPAKQE
jgi:hypothetical protein